MKVKENVKVFEVGPRDGLQNEKTFIPTPIKTEFIQLLGRANLSHIEVTSFVKESAIPQLADSREVSKILLNKNSSISYSCLTPNLVGYRQAMEANFKEVAVFTAASESFTQKNINKTIDESFKAFNEIFQESKKNHIQVRGYISCVIACPYEGWIAPEKVLTIVNRLVDNGAYEISLGETIGKATPERVDQLLSLILKYHPTNLFAGHFHDTYGMAIANVQKCLEFGIRSFDSSAGGLGGCPYAKGASGNLATEDLVYLLEESGYKTSIDLEKLVQASVFIESYLGRKLTSKTFQAIRAQNQNS